jgi:hypothetical protein
MIPGLVRFGTGSLRPARGTRGTGKITCNDPLVV